MFWLKLYIQNCCQKVNNQKRFVFVYTITKRAMQNLPFAASKFVTYKTAYTPKTLDALALLLSEKCKKK